MFGFHQVGGYRAAHITHTNKSDTHDRPLANDDQVLMIFAGYERKLRVIAQDALNRSYSRTLSAPIPTIRFASEARKSNNISKGRCEVFVPHFVVLL
jgi:hypothetical protein